MAATCPSHWAPSGCPCGSRVPPSSRSLRPGGWAVSVTNPIPFLLAPCPLLLGGISYERLPPAVALGGDQVGSTLNTRTSGSPGPKQGEGSVDGNVQEDTSRVGRPGWTGIKVGGGHQVRYQGWGGACQTDTAGSLLHAAHAGPLGPRMKTLWKDVQAACVRQTEGERRRSSS